MARAPDEDVIESPRRARGKGRLKTVATKTVKPPAAKLGAAEAVAGKTAALGPRLGGTAEDEAALDFALDAVSDDERRLLKRRREQIRRRLHAAG